MKFELGPRRGIYIDIAAEMKNSPPPLPERDLAAFEEFDLIYRTLCALLYNYVPMSGHPGGSISSGRFVAALLFDGMDYDLSDPDRDDADVVSYAAGHKALGLYAMWALRNEIARTAAPELLPRDERRQLRIEDLLGFRRNPITDTPLFRRHKSKHLDGHPTPATPFVRLSTGASGVGVASSVGLAFAAADYYGSRAPRIHIVEGEGGLTPGRSAESLAAAGTSSIANAVLHVDWNQSSIDSDRVCREGDKPGDYVQWTPAELCYLNDWNVIYVDDGMDFQQIASAQRRARTIENRQPTAIVYRTVKGWKYGMEGRASHGAGHKLCSDGFYNALAQLMGDAADRFPSCAPGEIRCKKPGCENEIMEDCFWNALGLIRGELAKCKSAPEVIARRLREAKSRLDGIARRPRSGAPDIEAVFTASENWTNGVPPALALKPGQSTTLRAELGRVLNHYNRLSRGAIFAAAADLVGSTNTNMATEGFGQGYFNASTNGSSRLLSIGGICEDAIGGVASGISSFGRHMGAAYSYGAFMAPLGHIAARLHSIANQARRDSTGAAYRPMIVVCAHAGLKTGEDGPTHADPQALQLFQENFPRGTMITLTPWGPDELWPLVSAALARRPAVIAPFVTRPNEAVPDREGLSIADSRLTAQGLYMLRRPKGKAQGTVVLQGSDVAYEFVNGALAMLDREGVQLNVYYVSSAELFEMLPHSEQRRVFPDEHAQDAMGITGFTMPTMYRWVKGEFGRGMSLSPFSKGRYMGSGQASFVLAEAGLDGESQFKAVMKYLKEKGSISSV
ncbi:MAG: hypothetical protein JXA24_06360 [Proteobacteria bacterium]|nr:hypothetical protein [Pseudomonadota bacterium]